MKINEFPGDRKNKILYNFDDPVFKDMDEDELKKYEDEDWNFFTDRDNAEENERNAEEAYNNPRKKQLEALKDRQWEMSPEEFEIEEDLERSKRYYTEKGKTYTGKEAGHDKHNRMNIDEAEADIWKGMLKHKDADPEERAIREKHADAKIKSLKMLHDTGNPKEESGHNITKSLWSPRSLGQIAIDHQLDMQELSKTTEKKELDDYYKVRDGRLFTQNLGGEDYTDPLDALKEKKGPVRVPVEYKDKWDNKERDNDEGDEIGPGHPLYEALTNIGEDQGIKMLKKLQKV